MILSLSVMSLNMALAQKTVKTKARSVRIAKDVSLKPPVLNMVEGSFIFEDPSGNNIIDANEECVIRMRVKNNGLGDAVGCSAILGAVGTTNGLKYETSHYLPTIKVGDEVLVEFPISSDMSTADGNLELTLMVNEPNGFGTNPSAMSIQTRAFMAPMLKVVDYSITNALGNTSLTKKMPFELQVLVQNITHGRAEDVEVEMILPQGVIPIGGNTKIPFTKFDGGRTESLDFSLIVNNQYTENVIPIKLKIKEKYGIYAEDKTIELKLNQTMASSKIVVDAKEDNFGDIAIASLTSAVDKNIPISRAVNDKTFAVIIANENYHNESNVPYALNDGRVFAQYCEKTLGIPAKNIHLKENATLNAIRGDVQWLTNVMRAYQGEAKVIFYYAGHGIPDEAQKTAYLLPVDGLGNNFSTGYKLSSIYSDLADAPSKSVTVFLDACFSGTKREGDMLAKNGRGIAIKVREDKVPGKMVVFAAAQGDEAAYPYSDQGHGMFTYFLLEKLQETSGNVTYKELGDYITTNVSQNSIVINGKSQTPKVQASYLLGDEWEKWVFSTKK